MRQHLNKCKIHRQTNSHILSFVRLCMSLSQCREIEDRDICEGCLKMTAQLCYHFKTLDCPRFKIFEIWCPILICLYPGSWISYRKVFVLQTKLWMPPIQWNIHSHKKSSKAKYVWVCLSVNFALIEMLTHLKSACRSTN